MNQIDSLVGIDELRVSEWIAEVMPGLKQPFRFARLTGGRSNLTFLIEDIDGARAVLRRPPLGTHPSGVHDVLREADTLRSLAGRVPVPEVFAVSDSTVGDAPLVLLEYLPGLIVRGRTDATELLDSSARRRTGLAMVEALVDLHDVDPVELNKPHLLDRRDHVRRQLKTWNRTWSETRVRVLPEIHEVYNWLQSRVPLQTDVSIVHGDFRIDNCMLDSSGEVAGILDWELSTIGDPMTDLGQLLAYWAEPTDSVMILNDPPTSASGFATRAELLEAYFERSPRTPIDIEYHVIFNVWKTACIVENVYARMLRDEMGESDRSPSSFGDQAAEIAAHALRLTRSAAFS